MPPQKVIVAMLNDKVAIVTGASRGLGLAICERFLSGGAKVVMVARESPEFTEAARDLGFRALGGNVYPHIGDVSKPDQVQQVVAHTKAALGRIDILVCNAGIYGPIGPVETNWWGDWVQAIQINLMGTVLCCREVVPVMRAQNHGKIITLSGGGATQPLPYFSAYAASKAAVVRFSETLAVELQGTGIDVNSVSPGALDTKIHDQVMAAGLLQAGTVMYERVAQIRSGESTPFTIPVDLIEFLASNESDGITGRLLSAVWDDWRDVDHLRATVKHPDAFTLRRFVH